MLVYIEVNNQLLQAAAAKPSLVVTDNNRTALAISILCLRADAVECLSRTDRIHRHGIPWIPCMYSIGKRSNDVRSNTWCLPIKQTPLYIQDNVVDKHIRRLTEWRHRRYANTQPPIFRQAASRSVCSWWHYSTGIIWIASRTNSYNIRRSQKRISMLILSSHECRRFAFLISLAL